MVLRQFYAAFPLSVFPLCFRSLDLDLAPFTFSLIFFSIRLHHRIFVRSVISFVYLSLHPASMFASSTRAGMATEK